MEISNVCLLFNITAYFTLKQLLDPYIENSNKLIFDSRRYYDKKEFRIEMSKDFLHLIYITTMDIIRDNSSIENVNNWIRSEKNEKIFIDKLEDVLINNQYHYLEKYKDFISKYKKNFS